MAEAQPQRRRRRIAVEEAFATTEQFDALRVLVETTTEYDPDLALARHQVDGTYIKSRRLLDLEGERLQLMDEAGIDLALLLLTAPGVQMFEPRLAADMSRRINDGLAELIGRHPGRFAGLAVIAPQAPAAAVREIERAIGSLKLSGIVVNSHTDGEYLSEQKYWPILEAAEAAGAPIYIHPRAPTPLMAKAYRTDRLEHAIWGFQAETGLHGLRLITGGMFDRFPKLQIVLGHAGEGIPFWLDRIDLMHTRPRGRPALQRKPSDYFRSNFAVTTSGMNWHVNVRFLIEALGADRIMFAADYPYQDMDTEVALMDSAPISEEDRDKIYFGNAERIFGL